MFLTNICLKDVVGCDGCVISKGLRFCMCYCYMVYKLCSDCSGRSVCSFGEHDGVEVKLCCSGLLDMVIICHRMNC
jgi:hypothetical protein